MPEWFDSAAYWTGVVAISGFGLLSSTLLACLALLLAIRLSSPGINATWEQARPIHWMFLAVGISWVHGLKRGRGTRRCGCRCERGKSEAHRGYHP